MSLLYAVVLPVFLLQTSTSSFGRGSSEVVIITERAAKLFQIVLVVLTMKCERAERVSWKILTFYSPKTAVSSYFFALEIKGGRPVRPLDPPLRYKHRLSVYIIELYKIFVNVSLHAWHN